MRCGASFFTAILATGIAMSVFMYTMIETLGATTIVYTEKDHQPSSSGPATVAKVVDLGEGYHLLDSSGPFKIGGLSVRGSVGFVGAISFDPGTLKLKQGGTGLGPSIGSGSYLIIDKQAPAEGDPLRWTQGYTFPYHLRLTSDGRGDLRYYNVVLHIVPNKNISLGKYNAGSLAYEYDGRENKGSVKIRVLEL